MNYTLFIARRYLRSKRRTGFISLITYLSIGGVGLGTAALVIVLSVMNGFEHEVRSRIIGADAHLRVTTFREKGAENWAAVMDKIRGMNYVEGITPFVLNNGMIRHKRSSEGCVIRGIDPTTAGEVTELPRMLVIGDLDSLSTSTGKKGDPLAGIVLGRVLADILYATVGDTVLLFSPTGAGIFSQPAISRFRVTGVFETGLAEFDQAFVYIHMSEAQKLFSMDNKITGLEVRTDKLEHADSVKKHINNEIGYPWYPRTWFEMRKALYSWMKLEKWAFFIILSLIILVAAFNIVSTLVMVTMEKRKEIGILVTMGATNNEIASIFKLQGLVIGFAGTSIGLATGWALLRAQQVYEFFSLPADVYLLNALPVRMLWTDFTAVGVVGVLLCWLAAVYPANRAASLDPVEAIRYE